MSEPLIECVPNFSEGRDMAVIKQITDEVEHVQGVRLLNVDPGKATNRTVVTFAGNPAAVVEAAFRAIKKASQLIDMSKHKGEHPRMGATDVCPLVPVSGITMEETIAFAKQLAKRVGVELGIPVYLYEYAATSPHRRNLSAIRAGEYEGFPKKIKDPQWLPDYGPKELNTKSGATVIGARDFLVAYNVNLNTNSVRLANSVAFDVREAGRVKKDERGETVRDAIGNPVTTPGSLKSVKAIGWYIEEYGIAQISMNLTNLNVAPLHIAFDEVCKKAEIRGLRVTGSELVGLVPLKCLTDAGTYFLHQQRRSSGVSEEELVAMAVRTMGLDELAPFEPQKRVIEYLLNDKKQDMLAEKTLRGFANETASESPAPGGGSVAAYLGALAASLGAMVANLSSHKKGWEEQWKFFSDYADKGQKLKDDLLKLVDEDTQAFNRIMAAFVLPKQTEDEKKTRSAAIQEATKYACEVPLQTMKVAYNSFDLLAVMAEKGNPNSISDAGVGAVCARSAVLGAYLNVKINAASLKDAETGKNILSQANEIKEKAIRREQELLELIEGRLNEK